ncbi:MAG: Stk1 family PASTA domain-containing Ser/Thr kinase [Firmicutes bacterium]|nr:Stk1 family PASTA domain-containing Ser/Thr kinase [Bacillota bacterium]
MSMIGKIFAERYKIIKILGTGGMADVYLGEDIMLDKLIAIKILKKELINNRESVRYFKNEAEVISHLSHPNIVEVYDVGMSDGHPYIVMEYVEGKTLKEIIREKAPLSPTFSIYVMEGVLSALIHSHKKGVIHRDIKPHNIMINKNGEVKVMDFGIARITDQGTTMTITNDIVGSVHYLSPEQASGAEITELSDVYSSGIVFYEMLTGRLPYEGQNPVSIAVNHIQGGLIPPKDIIEDIPQEVENIVLKATMRDPKKRFKSALDMNIYIEKARLLMEEGKINQVKRITLEEVNTDFDKKNLGSQKQENKKQDFKKVAIISLAVFIMLAVVLGLMSLLTGGVKKIVPDVVGMTEEDAIIKLKESGFQYTIEGIYSEDVDQGEVVEQTPEGNTLTSVSEVVQLKVSKGQDEIPIPNVVGSSEKEAKSVLKAEGFEVEVLNEYNSDVPVGDVIRQEPGASEKLLPGETVIIVVSDGEELVQIKMPNLIGKTLSSAELTLNNSKLLLGSVTNEESSDYLPGQVIKQSVKSGNNIMQGSSVDLVIAKEPTSKVTTIDITRSDGTNAATYSILISDSKGSRIETVSFAAGVLTTKKSITYYGVGTATIKDQNGNVVDAIGLE